MILPTVLTVLTVVIVVCEYDSLKIQPLVVNCVTLWSVVCMIILDIGYHFQILIIVFLRDINGISE